MREKIALARKGWKEGARGNQGSQVAIFAGDPGEWGLGRVTSGGKVAFGSSFSFVNQ